MTTYYAYLEKHVTTKSDRDSKGFEFSQIIFAPSTFDIWTKSYGDTPNYNAEGREGFETTRAALQERGITVRIDRLPFLLWRQSWAIGGEVTRTPLAEIPRYNNLNP